MQRILSFPAGKIWDPIFEARTSNSKNSTDKTKEDFYLGLFLNASLTNLVYGKNTEIRKTNAQKSVEACADFS